MKGYYTVDGYMGYVENGYQLFESEEAYYQWKFENFPELYSYSEE